MQPSETRVQHLLRTQSIAFLSAALVASTLIVLIGVLIEPRHALLSRLILALGSSGIGTSLGLVFGTITGATSLNKISSLIELTLDSHLHSSDDALKQFREVWRHYQCTRISGQLVWRYRVIDFSNFATPGKLVAALTVTGPDDAAHTYILEGFVIGSRLLIVQRASGGSSEGAVIGLYPMATQSFRGVVAGMVYLQSWDGREFLTAAMMSRKPIHPDATDGTVGTLPANTYNLLSQTWQREAAAIGLMPLLVPTNGGGAAAA